MTGAASILTQNFADLEALIEVSQTALKVDFVVAVGTIFIDDNIAAAVVDDPLRGRRKAIAADALSRARPSQPSPARSSPPARSSRIRSSCPPNRWSSGPARPGPARKAPCATLGRRRRRRGRGHSPRHRRGGRSACSPNRHRPSRPDAVVVRRRRAGSPMAGRAWAPPDSGDVARGVLGRAIAQCDVRKEYGCPRRGRRPNEGLSPVAC